MRSQAPASWAYTPYSCELLHHTPFWTLYPALNLWQSLTALLRCSRTSIRGCLLLFTPCAPQTLPRAAIRPCRELFRGAAARKAHALSGAAWWAGGRKRGPRTLALLRQMVRQAVTSSSPRAEAARAGHKTFKGKSPIRRERSLFCLGDSSGRTDCSTKPDRF